ncbi:MAG: hypothetical protein NT096_10340, partial [Proteobacteria bacterium]|nr:hypothetical protein [Pseudomonadota bacterium]
LPAIAKVGDQLAAVITNIDRKEKKVGLSIKEYKKHMEKAEVEEYLAQQESGTTTLGDIMKNGQEGSERGVQAASQKEEKTSERSEDSVKEGEEEI